FYVAYFYLCIYILYISFFFISDDPSAPVLSTLSYTTLFRSAFRRTSGSRVTRRRSTRPGLTLRWMKSTTSGCASPRRSPTLSSTDRKSTRLNSSHVKISYAVFCLKKKKKCRHLVVHMVIFYK